MVVELNILIRIEIRESPSPSGGSCLAKNKDEHFSRSNYLIWMTIRLKDRDLPQMILSLLNYPTRLKFELVEDSGSYILVIATCHISLRGSIDTCHESNPCR